MSDDTMIGLGIILGLIIGFALGYLFKSQRQDTPKYAGEIEVYDGASGRRVYSLSLNCEPEDLLIQEKVIFQIVDGRA